MGRTVRCPACQPAETAPAVNTSPAIPHQRNRKLHLPVVAIAETEIGPRSNPLPFLCPFPLPTACPFAGKTIGAIKRYPRRESVSIKIGLSAESPSVSLNRLIAVFRL